MAIAKLSQDSITAAGQQRSAGSYSFARFKTEILRGNLWLGLLHGSYLDAAYNTLFQER
jgi:hypothetical protein